VEPDEPDGPEGLVEPDGPVGLVVPVGEEPTPTPKPTSWAQADVNASSGMVVAHSSLRRMSAMAVCSKIMGFLPGANQSTDRRSK
jgi:hypothetical protein